MRCPPQCFGQSRAGLWRFEAPEAPHLLPAAHLHSGYHFPTLRAAATGLTAITFPYWESCAADRITGAGGAWVMLVIPTVAPTWFRTTVPPSLVSTISPTVPPGSARRRMSSLHPRHQFFLPRSTANSIVATGVLRAIASGSDFEI